MALITWTRSPGPAMFSISTMVLLPGDQKKQSCVATSTTHVEYIALYIVTKGLVMQAIGGSRVCSNRAYGYLH